MSSEAAESSRAREEAAEQEDSSAAVAHQQQRPWVALASIPVVFLGWHKKARELARGTADLLLELQDPPRASYLALPERLVPNHNCSAPRIIAAAPGRLLYVLNANYFLCDVRAGKVHRLPEPADLPIEPRPPRTMGLVADPSSPGDYVIAHLHPAEGRTRHDALLCYSTATDQWSVKQLASAPDHEPWGAHGVIPHDGYLWWVDVAYGMLFCDPFDDHPRLRLVRLPRVSEMYGLTNSARIRHHLSKSELLEEHRCVRLSEGKLRYVQISDLAYDRPAINHPPVDHVQVSDLSYRAAVNRPPVNPGVSMWTLADPEAADPWTLDYKVSFADIWAHHKYIAAGLPRGKVPNLALVDPNNHHVVYFFQKTALFAWDARAMDLVSCAEFLEDRAKHRHRQNSGFINANRDPHRQNSGFVDAWKWELQPTDGGSGMKGPGDEEELEEATGHVEELAPPSEPSVEAEATDQADEPDAWLP